MGTENDIRIFCENIRNLRNEEKLSKTRMAKILGISIKTLTQIENGIVPNRVTCRLLFRIYDNFKILPSEIMTKRK